MKGSNSHRDCDGTLDEAAKTKFGTKAQALAPRINRKHPPSTVLTSCEDWDTRFM
jgi:hypothetical protein